MKAVVTIGNGGYEKLIYKDVPVPHIGLGEVLLKVLAAGINNTEINTRIGWYSSTVATGTDAQSEAQGRENIHLADGGWNETTQFPLIQGTDCCGLVVSVNKNINNTLLGQRVLVRPCMRPSGYNTMSNIWMASDFDGAFAQYVKVPSSEVFPVNCNWSDSELGSIPCSYGTSENMLHRAKVSQGETVLVTGASGGVGSATIQLAKRRGAKVIAVSSKAKIDQIRAIGADRVITRDEDIIHKLEENSVQVVVDNVAGSNFHKMFKILARGGRYVSSGAIAGPMVTVDIRDIYLKDITIIGCTAWSKSVFPNLVSYIEQNEIKPLIAKTFPLDKIVDAQKEFLKKKHFGKFVLIPPSTNYN